MKDAIQNYFTGNHRAFYEKYLTQVKHIGGDEYQALCPFHRDKKPSLNFHNGKGTYLCHGCGEKGDLFHFYGKVNGLDTRADFPKILKGIASDFGVQCQERKSRIVKAYDYTDETGNLLFQACRMDPKDFRQRHKNGKGWTWNLKGIRRVLYRLPQIVKAHEVLLVEGEKDAETVAGMGLTGTTCPMGAGKWLPEYSESLKGKSVILIPDNDEAGRTHMTKVASSLKGFAKSLKWIDLPGLPNKGDLSDWAAAFDDPTEAGERLAVMIEQAEPYEVPTPPSSIISAADLLRLEIPEIKWAVKGIIPEGLTILAGKPKMGKSILALNLCIAVALGTKALGYANTEQGAVFYLALEDVKRRLKSRLKDCLMDDSTEGLTVPKKLSFATEWPRMGAGGLSKLDREISAVGDVRMVVIDTLKMIRPIEKANKRLYDLDYEPIQRLKTLADKHGIAVVVIHHLRKSAGEDVMDTMSGSFGLTGASDTNIVVSRTTKLADAKLHIVGRDIEAAEYAMEFTPDVLSWNIIGHADDVARTQNQQAIIDAVKEAGEITRSEIANETELKPNYISKTLQKLIKDNVVMKIDRNKYGPAYT